MQKSLHSVKKSQVGQVFLFMMIITILGFTAVITYYVIDQFYTGIAGVTANNTAMQAAEANMRGQVQSIDYALVFLMVSLIGGLIVTSFLIPSHPIFMVVNILGIFILIFLGMILSNIFGELVAGEGALASGLSAAADMFPYTVFIVNYLPYIGAVIIGVVSVVMFAKGQGSQGGGY